MGGIEDDVVAFAVAVGTGDAKAVTGGGEGEGEFGNLSATLGGEFALEGSLCRLCGQGFGRTLFASERSAVFGHWEIGSSVLCVLGFVCKRKKARADELAPIL